MDSQGSNITTSCLQLINSVKNFRGASSYVIDVIRRLSSASASTVSDVVIKTPRDVASLLSKISTNQL